MIWYAAWGTIIIMTFSENLTVGRFFGIVLGAALLQAIAQAAAKAILRKPPPEPEPPWQPADAEQIWRERYENLLRSTVEQESRATFSPPAGTANIKVTTLSEVRNLLLMHHTARLIDTSYNESRIAKQTNDTVAALNVFLEKRKAKT